MTENRKRGRPPKPHMTNRVVRWDRSDIDAAQQVVDRLGGTVSLSEVVRRAARFGLVRLLQDPDRLKKFPQTMNKCG